MLRILLSGLQRTQACRAGHTSLRTVAAGSTAQPLTVACDALNALLQQRLKCLASATPVTTRCFASSTSFEGSGPSAGQLSAVPFSVSRQEADAAFDAYHSNERNILVAKPAAGLQKVKEMYLPLWVARAQARSSLKGAEIGFNRLVRRYNPASKRTESTYEMQYRWVRPNVVFEQYFSPEMTEMQIVATYHYPHSDISKLRPGPSVAAAKAADRYMMTSPFDGSTRRVSTFELKAETGRAKAIGAIKSHQFNAARDFLMQAYRCDDTRGLDLDVDIQQFSAAPILLPVFLYSSRHFGNSKVRTFVAGFDAAKVSGVRVLDETRIGLATAAVASIAVLLSQSWQTYPVYQLFSFAIAAPALLVGFAAKYWPRIRNQLHQARRDADRYMNSKTDQTGSFSTSWTHAYSQFEQFRRSREQSRFEGGSSGFSAGRSSYKSSDPKGYYKLLEIEPSASKADVQAAFRGLAMKQHPDRFDDEKQKQVATVKFRHILEAYSVLRDNNKRQMYDSGQL